MKKGHTSLLVYLFLATLLTGVFTFIIIQTIDNPSKSEPTKTQSLPIFDEIPELLDHIQIDL